MQVKVTRIWVVFTFCTFGSGLSHHCLPAASLGQPTQLYFTRLALIIITWNTLGFGLKPHGGEGRDPRAAPRQGAITLCTRRRWWWQPSRRPTSSPNRTITFSQWSIKYFCDRPFMPRCVSRAPELTPHAYMDLVAIGWFYHWTFLWRSSIRSIQVAHLTQQPVVVVVLVCKRALPLGFRCRYLVNARRMFQCPDPG